MKRKTVRFSPTVSCKSGLNLFNYSLIYRLDTHRSEHYSGLITSVPRSCFIWEDLSGISAISVHSRRASVLGITIDGNKTVYSFFTSSFVRDNQWRRQQFFSVCLSFFRKKILGSLGGKYWRKNSCKVRPCALVREYEVRAVWNTVLRLNMLKLHSWNLSYPHSKPNKGSPGRTERVGRTSLRS